MSFLVAAYIAIWLALFGYLFYLKRRESKLRKELEELRKSSQKKSDRAVQKAKR